MKACNNLGIRHFGCIGHSIHLVIGPFVLEKKLPDIYEEDWALLSGLCIILKPFKDVTEILSGEKYPTFSQALPLLRTLENFLSDHNLFSEDVFYSISIYSRFPFFLLKYEGSND